MECEPLFSHSAPSFLHLFRASFFSPVGQLFFFEGQLGGHTEFLHENTIVESTPQKSTHSPLKKMECTPYSTRLNPLRWGHLFKPEKCKSWRAWPHFSTKVPLTKCRVSSRQFHFSSTRGELSILLHQKTNLELPTTFIRKNTTPVNGVCSVKNRRIPKKEEAPLFSKKKPHLDYYSKYFNQTGYLVLGDKSKLFHTFPVPGSHSIFHRRNTTIIFSDS